jgi:NADH:ubiquinone oxidoreductase subunit 5 (subunit L)/multisubunit Na+/H+ antiporter MnhA subunit
MKSHPDAPHHLPWFITSPGEIDVLMVVMAVVLFVAVLTIGILFLRLHSLPERMAHKGKKLQFEIVAVLCLLALFTHIHLFWVSALLLALIDIPDFGGSLGRMAGSLEKIADRAPDRRGDETPDDAGAAIPSHEDAPPIAETRSGKRKELLRA